MGFFSQGNEFSYFMLITSYLILNCIGEVEGVKIYPFVRRSSKAPPQPPLTPATLPSRGVQRERLAPHPLPPLVGSRTLLRGA